MTTLILSLFWSTVSTFTICLIVFLLFRLRIRTPKKETKPFSLVVDAKLSMDYQP
jgi:hypothetical protein